MRSAFPIEMKRRVLPLVSLGVAACAAGAAPLNTPVADSWSRGGFDAGPSLDARIAPCSDEGDAFYLVTSFDDPSPWAHTMLNAPGRSSLYEEGSVERAGGLRWLHDLSDGLCRAAGAESEHTRSCAEVRSVRRLTGTDDDPHGDKRFHVELSIVRGDGMNTWSVRGDMRLAGDVDTKDALLVKAHLDGQVHIRASERGTNAPTTSEYDRPVAVTMRRSCQE